MSSKIIPDLFLWDIFKRNLPIEQKQRQFFLFEIRKGKKKQAFRSLQQTVF